MALKGDRFEGIQSIDFFMDQVAERGGVVVGVTSVSGSGAALDQFNSRVEYAADASGKYPIGILMCDVVDLDLTKYHENWQKNTQQKGSKVTLLREGWVVTNMLAAGITPGLGLPAYIKTSGLFTTSSASGAVQVGYFESAKDSDGYVKVYVKLPR
jgi:hypothetical protein